MLSACKTSDPQPNAPASASAAATNAPVPASVGTNPSPGNASPVNTAGSRTTSTFCETAFTKPMTLALNEKCTDEERNSSLGRIFSEDIAHVTTWCDQALKHPERIAFDDKVAPTCAARIAERVRSLVLDKSKSLHAYRKLYEIPECKGLIIGKQVTGAPCDDDSQCSTGLTCVGIDLDARRPGTCRKRGQSGDACDDGHYSLDLSPEHAECVAGLGCVDGKCAPLKDNGATCDRHPICKSWHCLFKGKDVGTCTAPGAIGATCGDEGDCLSHRCQRGKCANKLKAGEKCANDSDCLGDCSDSTHTCVSVCGSG